MQKIVLQVLAVIFVTVPAFAAGKAQHIVVIVWDGMRPDFITREYAPTLYRLAQDGVFFENHHSVYCTATEVNGTAIATGMYPASSGVIANNDYRPDINSSRASALQSLSAVRKGDELTGGKYLPCPTTAEILRKAGFTTAISGSKDVALLHDRRERTNDSAINIFEGKALPSSALDAVKAAIGPFPSAAETKSLEPNEKRDDWTTKALLNVLWTNGVPHYSVLWLSEPDSSQHAAGPGSAKAIAGIASSDRKLAAVLAELDKRGVRDKTDIFVVSDHGFSTVGWTTDVCKELQKAGFSAYREFKSTPQPGDILVIGQGGSDLFYITGHDIGVTGKLVDFLQRQDFTGVIFTRKAMKGTFSLRDGNIQSPEPPDVVLSMRWSGDKNSNGTPGMFWSDGNTIGRGSHASLSRFDVHNTLVAAGPDIKKGFRSELPTGNTDIAPTVLWLLGVKSEKAMDGRVLSEALTVKGPKVGKVTSKQLDASRKDGINWQQYLKISRVNDTIYLDEGNGSNPAR